MSDPGKEELFLELAADLTRFYTLLWQSVRAASGDASPAPLPPDQMADQIRKLWSSLLPRLEKNSIVKNKIEQEMKEGLRIAAAHQDLDAGDLNRAAVREEAAQLLTTGRVKASGLSDLVALFRRH